MKWILKGDANMDTFMALQMVERKNVQFSHLKTRVEKSVVQYKLEAMWSHTIKIYLEHGRINFIRRGVLA